MIDRRAAFQKIDAGQGDASRDASPRSIELLWSAHDQRAVSSAHTATRSIVCHANGCVMAASGGPTVGRFSSRGRLH